MSWRHRILYPYLTCFCDLFNVLDPWREPITYFSLASYEKHQKGVGISDLCVVQHVQWVTIHNTRCSHIHQGRALLTEFGSFCNLTQWAGSWQFPQTGEIPEPDTVLWTVTHRVKALAKLRLMNCLSESFEYWCISTWHTVWLKPGPTIMRPQVIDWI